MPKTAHLSNTAFQPLFDKYGRNLVTKEKSKYRRALEKVAKLELNEYLGEADIHNLTTEQLAVKIGEIGVAEVITKQEQFDFQLPIAVLNEINKCRIREELLVVWDKYPKLQSMNKFQESWKAQKKRIEQKQDKE